MKKSDHEKSGQVCIEVDNARAIGNFYSADVDVEDSELEDRVKDNIEYSDLLSQSRETLDDEDEYEPGNPIISQISEVD